MTIIGRLPGALTAAAAAALGAATLAVHWDSGVQLPGHRVSQGAMVVIELCLLAVPLLARRLAPVAPNAAARAVRRGGYLAVWALLLATALVSRFGSARFDGDPPPADDRGALAGAVAGGLLFCCLFVGYAAGFHVLTSERLALPSHVLRIATGAGVTGGVLTWALVPFGGLWRPLPAWLWPVYLLVLLCLPPLVPLAATWIVARRDRTASPWTAVLAGVLAAGTAVVVLTVLSLFSLRIAPELAPLQWANPDPAVPHGTPFEIRMSVGDTAAGYLAVLVLGPLAGWLLGIFGAAPAGGREAPPARTGPPGDGHGSVPHTSVPL